MGPSLHGAAPLQWGFKVLMLKDMAMAHPGLGPAPGEVWHTAGRDGGV